MLIQLTSIVCDQCDGSCSLVRCPLCLHHSYLDDWEVYDGDGGGIIGICPMCDKPSAGGYIPVGRACRVDVERLARAEEASSRKGRSGAARRRKAGFAS